MTTPSLPAAAKHHPATRISPSPGAATAARFHTPRPYNKPCSRTGRHTPASSPPPRATTTPTAASPSPSSLNTRLISDHDIPFYLLVKSPGDDLAALARAAARLRPYLGEHCRLLQNGNNLAVLPAWLDKAHAVAHLQQHYRAQYGAILSIGMGDSTSDLPFMRHCDYLLTPAESQIAQCWDDATAP